MKRVPLYRAPIAGLMSLALATTILSVTAIPDPPPCAGKPDDQDLRAKDVDEKVRRIADLT